MSEPKISIIIPTWNGCDLLRVCLDSLRAQTCQDFEILVVDDCSTDATVQHLEADYPDAQLIKRNVNGGFCKAVNTGLAQRKCPYVLLLNNDMTLDPNFIEFMLNAALTSDAALFAPLVLWNDARNTIYSAGDRQLSNGRPEPIGFRETLSDFKLPKDIFGVSAGAGLYRREVFDTIGVLDESFGAYFEDSDLNWRARRAGFTAQLVSEAIAYHVGSASITGRTWWRTRQCWRNHALLVAKNMPLHQLLRHSPGVLAEHLRGAYRTLSATRCEFGLVKAAWVTFTTWCSIWPRLPKALMTRFRHP